MIHVIASVTLRPGTKSHFIRELSAVLGKIRAERGCIQYELLEDLRLGLPREVDVRPDVVTVLERWSDVQALHVHLSADHMVEYRSRTTTFVESVQLRILKSCADSSAPG
jgi:quinol monooxygenase YgiN